MLNAAGLAACSACLLFKLVTCSNSVDIWLKLAFSCCTCIIHRFDPKVIAIAGQPWHGHAQCHTWLTVDEAAAGLTFFF